MAEKFDIDARERALRAACKLNHPQRLELTKLIQKGSTCLDIEREYEKMTGLLVEPVIVRLWIDSNKVTNIHSDYFY